MIMDQEASQALANWTVQARKGVIELCVLNALRGADRYGYDLVRALRGMGLGVTEGTLYPLLARLKRMGWISSRLEESQRGPARKYYALGPRGAKACRMMNSAFRALGRAVNLLKKEASARERLRADRPRRPSPRGRPPSRRPGRG